MNQFPLIGKGAFIHYLSQLYKDATHPQGNIPLALDFAQSLGVQTLALKIGNGQVPWVGLESFITQARARGITVLGWWFYWGYANEGEISGKHTAYLASIGLQGLLLDVEGQFDASLGTSGTLAQRRLNLAPKAHAIGQGIRKYNPTLPVALCSWWFPDWRATPMAAFLQYCDANMPQVYSFGVDGGVSAATAAQRINTSIAQYEKAVHGAWRGETMPALAAFHQDGGTVTVPQLAAVNARTKELGLRGLIWWFLPHLIEKPDWAAAIKAHDWPTNYVTDPPPDPEPVPLTLEQRMDRADAFFRAHGWL